MPTVWNLFHSLAAISRKINKSHVQQSFLLKSISSVIWPLQGAVSLAAFPSRKFSFGKAEDNKTGLSVVFCYNMNSIVKIPQTISSFSTFIVSLQQSLCFTITAIQSLLCWINNISITNTTTQGSVQILQRFFFAWIVRHGQRPKYCWIY